jgi:hypothetical protein
VASQNWHTPSTGQSFDAPTTTDLSHTVGDPFAGQSMSGSNTMSERPPFGAEGSPSESSALTESAADQGGMVSAVHTAPGSAPGSADHQTDTKVH